MKDKKSTLPSVAAFRDRRTSVLREGAELSVPERHPSPEHFLHGGELLTSREQIAIKTILSSSMAICMWEPKSGVGGAAHFLLPHLAGEGEGSPRFGNIAIVTLIEELALLGAPEDQLLVKLVGGSSVHRGKESALGERNLEVAREVLAELGIPVVGEEVGGARVRRLTFLTDDGRTWVGEY